MQSVNSTKPQNDQKRGRASSPRCWSPCKRVVTVETGMHVGMLHVPGDTLWFFLIKSCYCGSINEAPPPPTLPRPRCFSGVVRAVVSWLMTYPRTLSGQLVRIKCERWPSGGRDATVEATAAPPTSLQHTHTHAHADGCEHTGLQPPCVLSPRAPCILMIQSCHQRALLCFIFLFFIFIPAVRGDVRF